MSLQVECFDEKKAEQELKKCPKIVRDYVKLLKSSRDRWKDISDKAISKLKIQEHFKEFKTFVMENYINNQIKEATK